MAIIIAGSKDFKCPHCGGDRLLVPILMTAQGAMQVTQVVGKATITQQARGYGVQVPEGLMCHTCGDCGKLVMQSDIEALAKDNECAINADKCKMEGNTSEYTKQNASEEGEDNVGEGEVAS